MSMTMNKYLATLGLTGALSGCYDQPEKQPVICYEQGGIVVPQTITDERYVLVQRGDSYTARDSFNVRELLGCGVIFSSPLPLDIAVKIAQIETELNSK